MSKLIANAEMLSKLASVDKETMIVDGKGNLLGLFTPAEKTPPRLEPPITEELLRQAASKERGITTAELLAKLDELEKNR